MRNLKNQTAPFHSIALSGPGRMCISQAPRESVVIKVPDELRPYVEMAVVDQELRLALRTPTVVPLVRWRESVTYDVTVKELRALRVLGSARVEIPDLDSDELTIEVLGSGEVAIEQLTADSLHCAVAGSAIVDIAGDIETQRITIGGSGRYQAEGLVSDFADVKVTGSGRAAIQVNHELSASVIGSGQICYQGDPDVDQQTIGSGTIRRLSGRATGDLGREVPNS